MSVEVLGRDLLGEVKVEGLDEVWRDHQPLLLHRDHRLTFSSVYAHHESLMPIHNLPSGFHFSIDSLTSSRILL